jgi:Mrp family chromosome partitioning ATPase
VPGQIAPWLIAHHDPAHPISRQYYELLRGVRQTARARRDARALLFVSSEHGIGATSALLNLAITAAREGKGEVLIVDGHFADPGVADQLELPSTPGLSDVLTGEIAWQEAVQSTPIKSLQVLAAGRRIAALQVTAPALTQTFKQVSARFATVFVDGPCCDEIELALRFCVACDCIFAVVPHDRADSVLTADLVERFAATGCHVSGAIVTQN